VLYCLLSSMAFVHPTAKRHGRHMTQLLPLYRMRVPIIAALLALWLFPAFAAARSASVRIAIIETETARDSPSSKARTCSGSTSLASTGEVNWPTLLEFVMKAAGEDVSPEI